MATNRRRKGGLAGQGTTGGAKSYTKLRAATDVETGYGRNSKGQYDANARLSSKLGRSGQIISRRQRYYDMRLAFGLAGG